MLLHGPGRASPAQFILARPGPSRCEVGLTRPGPGPAVKQNSGPRARAILQYTCAQRTAYTAAKRCPRVMGRRRIVLYFDNSSFFHLLASPPMDDDYVNIFRRIQAGALCEQRTRDYYCKKNPTITCEKQKQETTFDE